MLTSTDIPELLQPGNTIPLPGRILNSPYGVLIQDRKKTSILSPYLTDKYIKIPIYFIEKDKALGIMILEKPTKLSIEESKNMQKSHMIDKEEIQKRWPNAKFLYNYPIELISKFNPSKTIIITEDIQTWLSVVTFKGTEFGSPSELTDNELFEAHGKLHKMWFALSGTKEDIINYHIILKNEIVGREFEHEERDELDIYSEKAQKKLGDSIFKIGFCGSKGLIKEEGPGHKFYTAIVCENKGKRLFINSSEKVNRNISELGSDFTVSIKDKFKSYKAINFGPFSIIPIPVINTSKEQKYAFLIKATDKRILYATNILKWHKEDLKKYVKNIDLAIIDGYSLYKNSFKKDIHASVEHQLKEWYTIDKVNRVIVANLGKNLLKIGDDELIAKMREMTDSSVAIAVDNKIIDLSDDIIENEIIEKPYPSEHSCRLNLPSKYDKFARKNCYIKHKGKCIDVIFGIKEGKSEIQALRYPSGKWVMAQAKSHCKGRGGIFEAAKKTKEIFNCECLNCGYKMQSEKHCSDIKCPKCGGEMRRAERPGSGKK